MYQLTEKTPENLSRVIIEYKSGILGFAWYKDGMFRPDETKEWIKPDEVKSWLPYKELRYKLGL